MGERLCRYCEKTFQPSKYQPQQTVCSESLCQKRRRTEYRRQKLKTDEEYRQVCRDSSRKWRSENPDYWKRYREEHPNAVAQYRGKQQGRDGKQRFLDSLRNNSSDLCLGRHLDHGVAQCFSLRPELGFGSCTMTYLVTKKNFGIVGLSLGEHVMHDSRELMCSCRNGRWRSELGAHAAKKIAEWTLTAK